MVSAVSVKSNTGSTIAIIVAIFAALGIGYFVVTRGLKDFKFPDLNIPGLSDFNLDFLKTKVPLENVPALDVLPKGFGLDQPGAFQRAFNVIFASGASIERSLITRPVAPSGSVAGIRGRPLAFRAVARRIPTFFGSITTGQGTRSIAGSAALFQRLLDNFRRTSNRKAVQQPRAIGGFSSRFQPAGFIRGPTLTNLKQFRRRQVNLAGRRFRAGR